MPIYTQLKGTGVAIITPFTKSGKVDFIGLTKVVNHIIKGKCEYMVVLGTTGETATLSAEEKMWVVAHIIKENKNRIPLVLGIGGNNTQEVIETIKHINLSAFVAILSVSPYYNKPSQRGIYEH